MTDFRKEFLFLFVSTNLTVDSQFLEESCSQDFTPAISHQLCQHSNRQEEPQNDRVRAADKLSLASKKDVLSLSLSFLSATQHPAGISVLLFPLGCTDEVLFIRSHPTRFSLSWTGTRVGRVWTTLYSGAAFVLRHSQ